MFRTAVRLILTLGVIGTVMTKERRHFAGIEQWVGDFWARHTKWSEPAELEKGVLTALDTSRLIKKKPLLERDEELHRFVQDRLNNGSQSDLPSLLDSFQKAKPNYSRLAAISTQSLTGNGLQDGISQWRDGAEPFYTHMAAVAKSGLSRLGMGTVLIVAERMPTLTPDAVNSSKKTAFYSVCALCGKGAQCDITRHNYTISLECPHCHHITTILAADLKGDMHYANEFLTGFAPPAHFPKGCSKMDEMLIIWRAVGDICHYQKDTNDVVNDPADAWQFALETQRLGTGDCEDSAIMLADWLASRGFEARVALGRYAERGGHAWVVVKLDGKEYLLESTLPDRNPEHPPPLASDVGSRYVPEAQLDYYAIHVRSTPREMWNGGYFKDEKWLRIVPRERPPLQSELASTALRPAILRTMFTAAAPP